MKLSDVITPGDKIDIKMLQEATRKIMEERSRKSIKVRSATFFRIRNWKFLCRQVVEEWCYFNWRGSAALFFIQKAVCITAQQL